MILPIKITLIVILLLSIILPFGAFLLGERTKGRYKATRGINCLAFFGTFLIANILFYSGNAHAAGEAASSSANGLGYIAAALVTGMSCIGGGIAVASAASAALGAISEDSSILGKSLIFVAMAEGVCLYGLIVSFMILGQLS